MKAVKQLLVTLSIISLVSCATGKYVPPDDISASKLTITANHMSSEPYICNAENKREFIGGTIFPKNTKLMSKFAREYSLIETRVPQSREIVFGVYRYVAFYGTVYECGNSLAFTPESGFDYHVILGEKSQECTLTMYRTNKGGTREIDPSAGPAINKCL